MKIPEKLGEDVELVKRAFGRVAINRRFRNPDGREDDFLLWHTNKVAAIVVPVTVDGKLLVMQQFRHGVNRVTWEVPGGNPKGGETALQVALAELAEETGYEPTEAFCFGGDYEFEPATYDAFYSAWLALGCRKTKEPTRDYTEHMAVAEIPIAEWLGMIFSGQVKDDKSIALTLLALHRLGAKIMPP